MPDTPAAVAPDLIADIGRTGALRYLAGLLLERQGWRRRWQVVRLVVAVLFA